MNPLEIIRSSKFFDRSYYLNTYRDVLNDSMSPEKHYLSVGCYEGRNPGPNFSTVEYYKHNEDVLRAKANALIHYEMYGKYENRYKVNCHKISDNALRSCINNDNKYSCFFTVILFVSKSNTEYDIRATLDSLFNQTSLNFEILIVDTGLRNYSYNAIFEYIDNANIDTKLMCCDNLNIKSDELCFGASIEEAISLSSGRYVIFLRSGDYVQSDHINILNSKLNECSPKIPELIINNVEFIGDGYFGIYDKINNYDDTISFDKFVNGFYYHFSAFCIKKALLNNIDFEKIFSMNDFYTQLTFNISVSNHIIYVNSLRTIVKIDSGFSLYSNFKDDNLRTRSRVSNVSSEYHLKYLVDRNFLKLDKRLVSGNVFLNKNQSLIIDTINLAEYLCSKKALDFAIQVFYFCYNILNFKSNNIIYRIFDCYILLYELNQAEDLILAVVENNPAEEHKLISRKDILNSSKAAHYNVIVNEAEFDVNCVSHLLSNSKLCNYKASDLINVKFVFTNPGVPFSAFVIEKVNYQRVYIDYKSDNSCDDKYLTLELNLLNTRKIGIISDSQVKWIFVVSKELVQGVLRGKDNWLFLDNDSNESVSQYIGNKLISNTELNNWKKYFEYVQKVPNYVLVVPPSKEQVFPQYYPHKRASWCPIDQFLDFIHSYDVNSIYPIDLLQKDITSYVRTETHWSYKSAFDVFCEIISFFNIGYSNSMLPKISFKLTKTVGDLGSKCNPLEFSDYYTIDMIDDHSTLIFRNFVANRQGKISKFHNDSAIIKKKVIVFGDSFSTILEPFFTCFFADVIRVWSNATIIENIVEFEKPDYIVAEITERFLVRSPVILHNIVDYKPCFKLDLPKNDIENLFNFATSGLKIYDDYINSYKAIFSNDGSHI